MIQKNERSFLENEHVFLEGLKFDNLTYSRQDRETLLWLEKIRKHKLKAKRNWKTLWIWLSSCP